MVRDSFSRFERHIERLVEGSFARLFSGHLHPREIAIQLARAMEDNAQAGESGQIVAPHVYTVALNPTDYDALLEEQPDLADSLSAELVNMALSAGLHMPATPSVDVVADEGVASHRAIVQASDSAAVNLEDSTAALEPMQVEAARTSGPAALAASLMVGDDHRVIPLAREVINVGRSRENHIILDDARVSRQHAQLRFRLGQYVLYDLDSQGGTTVNGQPVQECILQHGDVIALGGVRLIYSEDGEDGHEPGGDSPADNPHGLEETDGHSPAGPPA